MTRLTSTVARRAQAKPHPSIPDCTFHIYVAKLGCLTLMVQNGRAQVARGAVNTPDCTIQLDSAPTADALLDGRLSPIAAVIRGKARASGNTGLAQRHLAELLGA